MIVSNLRLYYKWLKLWLLNGRDPLDLPRYPPRSPELKFLMEWCGVPDTPAFHRLLEKESQGYVGLPNYTYLDSDAPVGVKYAGPNRIDKLLAIKDVVRDQLVAGQRTAKSSATGLGQLLLPNTRIYYPDGPAGIGDPRNELIGMWRYIVDRYGNAEAALAFHDAKHFY